MAVAHWHPSAQVILFITNLRNALGGGYPCATLAVSMDVTSVLSGTATPLWRDAHQKRAAGATQILVLGSRLQVTSTSAATCGSICSI